MIAEAQPVARFIRRRPSGYTVMELLIAAAIGVVLTGVMIMIWMTISRSSTVTTSHAETRDFARNGIARLAREIRDSEAVPGFEAVLEATGSSLAFTTTFNRPGAEVDTTKPRLVRYWYDPRKTIDGEPVLYRPLYRDLYADGVTDYKTADPVRHDVVVPYLLNSDDAPPVFSYTYLDDGGNTVPTPTASPYTPVFQVDLPADRARIQLVRIHVLVDLDPGKSPNLMEITTQAQLRNQRVLY